MSNEARNIITKKDLQVSFRNQDLLPVNGFISFCFAYGINTDKKELEYFEKKKLLLPAIRIRKGVAELYKVEKGIVRNSLVWEKNYEEGKHGKILEIWHTHEPINIKGKEWLKYYQNSNSLIYPSKSSFRPWKQYPDTNGLARNDSYSLQGCYETFYSRLQIFPLKYIQKRRSITFKNESIFMFPKDWAEIGERITSLFKKEDSNISIIKKVKEYYVFFDLINDIDDLYKKRMLNLNEKIKEANLTASESGGRLSERDKKVCINEVDKDFITEVEDLMNKHKFGVTDLKNWRWTIQSLGLFGLRKRNDEVGMAYLSCIPEGKLITTEQPYHIVNLINWVTNLLTGEKISIKDLLLHYSDYRECPYCGNKYKPPRIDSQTCGNLTCISQHEYALKRKGRKERRYS